MANLKVSGGVHISLLQNGDSLNTVLNATAPLYQTFKKGTQDYNPNWATMADANRPTVYPRVYSAHEGRTHSPANVSWKYNGVAMQFDSSGVATFPDICAGKIKQIDYNGSKALKMVGNVASEANNDSDTITFSGTVSASGQTIDVSAEITVLVEEASANLFRLFINTTDDVIDGDETSVTLNAQLFNNGAAVTSGVQFEFLKMDGTVLRAKNASGSFAVTRAMIDSELLVVCKAYISNNVVAQEQRQVWDSTDPYIIVCDQGSNVSQSPLDDTKYGFSLKNLRTESIVPGISFTIKVFKNATNADITSQFTKTSTSVTITGAKILEHKAMYVQVECTINE